MLYKITFYTTCLFLFGCASIMNGRHQNINVVTTNNTYKNSTTCHIKNEEGSWKVSGNEAVKIHRDGNEMNVSCKNKKQSGKASVSPKFESQFLFVDLYMDLCIISCVVDGLNNAFYSYPSAVSVRMENK